MMPSSSRIHLLATAVAALCNTVTAVAIRPDDRPVACTPQRETRSVGDIKPYQNYQYVQMTAPHTCNNESEDDGCEIAASTVKGTSTEWSASVSADGWISAGFAVSNYEESGEVETCYGGQGDVICVWYRFAHTAYTVQDWYKPCTDLGPGPWEKTGGEYLMVSPNKNTVGSGSICGKNGQCKSRDHRFWPDLPSSVAGGPKDFPFSSDEENSMLWPPEESMEYGDDCRTEIFWDARLTMCDK